MKKIYALLIGCCSYMLPVQAQWQMRSASPTAGIVELNVLTEDSLFASSSGSEGLLRSVNGGQSWDTLTFPNVANFKVHFLDPQTGFIAGYSAFAIGPTCFKTANGGQTWQPMYDTIGGGDYFHKIHFVNKDTGFTSRVGLLSRTTDGGLSFSHQELIPDNHYITNIHFISQSTGFVSLVQYGDASHIDRIFKTTDCGATWSEVYNESSGPQQVFVYDGLSQMQFVDQQHGFAITTGSPGKILKTTDGGNSWTELTGHNFTGYSLTDIHFVTTQTGYVVYSQRIYKTSNGGQSWAMQQTNPQDILVLEVEMLNEQLGFASGHGLFKTTNGGGPTSIHDRTATQAGFVIYPNPAKDIVYIQNRNNIPLRGLVIYDISGKVHQRYTEGHIPVVLLLDGFSGGTYLLHLYTDAGVYTEKLQVLP